MSRGEVRRAKEARRKEPGKILDREYYEIEETYKGEFEDIDLFPVRTYTFAVYSYAKAKRIYKRESKRPEQDTALYRIYAYCDEKPRVARQVVYKHHDNKRGE